MIIKVLAFKSSGNWTRTSDLRVMSLKVIKLNRLQMPTKYMFISTLHNL